MPVSAISDKVKKKGPEYIMVDSLIGRIFQLEKTNSLFILGDTHALLRKTKCI